MKKMLIWLILLLSMQYLKAQCNAIERIRINSVTANTECDMDELIAEYNVNWDILLSHHGNASACFYWFYKAELERICWNAQDGIDMEAHDTTLMADCNTLFAVFGYANNDGGGLQCGSDFYLNPFSSLLPVELVSIQVTAGDNYNEVKWITDSEIDNEGFEVQWSLDAVNWTSISFLPGNGFSNERKEWCYFHENYVENNYYRVVQHDNDGEQTYSEAVYIKREVIIEEKVEYYDIYGRRVENITNAGVYIKYYIDRHLHEKVFIYPK